MPTGTPARTPASISFRSRSGLAQVKRPARHAAQEELARVVSAQLAAGAGESDDGLLRPERHVVGISHGPHAATTGVIAGFTDAAGFLGIAGSYRSRASQSRQ